MVSRDFNHLYSVVCIVWYMANPRMSEEVISELTASGGKLSLSAAFGGEL